MKDAEILEMAKQADKVGAFKGPTARDMHFARLIQQAQREEDAEICLEVRLNDGDGQHTQWYAGVDECAAAIRNSGGE